MITYILVLREDRSEAPGNGKEGKGHLPNQDKQNTRRKIEETCDRLKMGNVYINYILAEKVLPGRLVVLLRLEFSMTHHSLFW
ncbi:hypothetical protein AVEN_258534-1 [Araneus ventricosus]|uniref:Uncharacterized protein n=1 Tax=Araneus ventricosus TaxID=182803 RepID=A0A4Y2I513_ARAVE|nr:hypothetical protein AVEN_258534-1 [Araneus ventricosus]